MAIDTQRLKGADLLLSKLRMLPKEVVSKKGGPVKRALRRGAVLIQKQAIENARNIVASPDEDGYISTGTLAASIRVLRDPHPERSGANERYRITIPKSRKYAEALQSGSRKGPLPAAATGRYLEFGTELRPPTPWLVPAYFSKRQEALDTVMDELIRQIDKYWKKYG